MEKQSLSKYHSFSYGARRGAGRLLSVLGRLFLCLIFGFPFYWMVITSLKTKAESIQWPPTMWPRILSLDGYKTVMTAMDLTKYFKNSLFIIFWVIVIQLLVMIPAAYAFAKYEFRGKKIMFALVMMAYMTPTVVTFIPVYIMFAKIQPFGINLLNTLWPQILPFGANAFGIFLLRQSFMQIPEEVIESARMDNAGEMSIMAHIMVPMSKATIVTVLLFSFINHWNAYFWPLVMCRTDEVKPLILAVADIKNVEEGIVWPTMMAGNTLVMLPIIILFVFASQKIIASMAYRGVK